MKQPLTVSAYADRIKKARHTVAKWVDLAKVGDELPGGGVVTASPDGRKFVDVDVEKGEAS